MLNWKEGVDTYTEQTAAEKLGLTQRYNDRVAVPPNEIPNLVAALEMNGALCNARLSCYRCVERDR